MEEIREKSEARVKKKTLKAVLEECQRALESLNDVVTDDDDKDVTVNDDDDDSKLVNVKENCPDSPSCSDPQAEELCVLIKSRVRGPEFLGKLESAQFAVQSEEGSSWDMVADNDLWEGGNVDDEEEYVVVRQEDIVDGIACFMAAYLLSLKETKDLAPNKLQDALSKTFSLKKKKGKLRKALDGTKVIYNVASWSATAIGQLRVLDLFEAEVNDDEVDWISCFPEGETCLESLTFDCVESPRIEFSALENLLARSPNLKKLRLNRYISIGQLHRLMARAPQLTHLGTGSFCPSDIAQEAEFELDYRAAFSACKSIVCLSGFREIAPEFLPAIYPICANLTSLNFSYANINSEQLKSVICHCHKLQTFLVLDTVGDEGLQAVAATCKDLRELRVFPIDAREDSEGFVSEIGLLAISEGCRKLRSILYFCQMMTNAAVIAMSKNCPDLVVFRLCIMGRHRPDHRTNKPMDEGFGAIVMNCKKLTRLAVSGLLTDKAFIYIGHYGKLVRTLSVAFAGDTDVALKYVLEGCPKLQKLEVRDCPFGDSVLLSGLTRFYNMRFLWMSTCRLTLPACRQIAQEMPHLVVEVFTNETIVVEDGDEFVNTLYMYRSLDGPRNDAPEHVKIL